MASRPSATCKPESPYELPSAGGHTAAANANATYSVLDRKSVTPSSSTYSSLDRTMSPGAKAPAAVYETVSDLPANAYEQPDLPPRGARTATIGAPPLPPAAILPPGAGGIYANAADIALEQLAATVGCYHAGINRSIAEQLLGPKPKGTYLVRDSSLETSDFSLSWQTGAGIGHLQINKLPDGALVLAGFTEFKFKSIQDLIAYYRHAQITLVGKGLTSLVTPLAPVSSVAAVIAASSASAAPPPPAPHSRAPVAPPVTAAAPLAPRPALALPTDRPRAQSTVPVPAPVANSESYKRTKPILTFAEIQAYSGSPSLNKEFDPTCKEEYLSDADFESILGLTRAAFMRKPNWTRNKIKAKAGLD